MDLNTILKTALELNASDIHLVVGALADGAAAHGDDPDGLPGDHAGGCASRMLQMMATDMQMAMFEKIKDVDFSYELPGLGRFRVNAHMQRQSVGIALRAIKEDIPADGRI